MRTTLTLDGDVTAKPDREMRRNGKSFKEAVNYDLALHSATMGPSPRDNSANIVSRRLCAADTADSIAIQ